MGQLSKVLRDAEGQRLIYWCQGCDMAHSVRLKPDGPHTWDGNAQAPTFVPSVLYNAEQFKDGRICHTFIRNGMVEFLNDCTHRYAGQTVPLPDLPDWLQDDWPARHAVREQAARMLERLRGRLRQP